MAVITIAAESPLAMPMAAPCVWAWAHVLRDLAFTWQRFYSGLLRSLALKKVVARKGVSEGFERSPLGPEPFRRFVTLVRF